MRVFHESLQSWVIFNNESRILGAGPVPAPILTILEKSAGTEFKATTGGIISKVM